ncbi:Major structural phage protein [Streptomyces microflavus DSM 40593]|uniref:Major structural phage protein n=1 Tax=Streptomyces microflavus DSM 40593 TaxID=1303692 RepID=N0CSK7_STRMI|nr:Major structural phage protein [Streptomyces microflavus]AGK78630.1 Major structural phage protein [Streptomyces microflavus DSM 40593]
MAVTLVEAAKLSTTSLQRGVIETFVQESSILDRIPFMTIEGNAYGYNEEATLPGVAFRAVNEAYTESTGTVNPKSESLVILGGDADVDNFIVKTRGNLNDQRATQTRMKVKAAGYKFQDTFFNGDVAVDAKSFDGLKKRLIGAQVIDAATNGIGPVAGGHDFFDVLDAAIARVPGINGSNGAIYANSAAIARVKSSARRLGGVEMIRETLTQKMVQTYNGIPMLDPGQTAAGVDILPQTETQGSASGITSSIYVVRFGQDEGDRAVTGLTNGGVQVKDLGELQEKPALRTRIEFYTGLAVFGGKAAARIRGVLNT